MTEILNVVVIRDALEKEGRSLKWLVGRLGMEQSTGYALLRSGELPKDPEARQRLVSIIAEALSLEPDSLVLRPPGLDRATA